MKKTDLNILNRLAVKGTNLLKEGNYFKLVKLLSCVALVTENYYLVDKIHHMIKEKSKNDFYLSSEMEIDKKYWKGCPRCGDTQNPMERECYTWYVSLPNMEKNSSFEDFIIHQYYLDWYCPVCLEKVEEDE